MEEKGIDVASIPGIGTAAKKRESEDKRKKTDRNAPKS